MVGGTKRAFCAYHPGVSSRSPGSAAGTGRVRARDIDRVATRARLDAAYEEGQLGADEYHERSERAGRAETLGELHRLVGDLQPSPGVSDLPQPDSARTKARKGGYPPRVRARHVDRAATCAVLDAALADGQLSVDDHHALTELAGAATTLGELAELTADLQRPADAPGPPRPPLPHRRYWFPAGVAALALAAAVGMYAVVDRPAAAPAGPPSVDLGVIEPKVIPTPNLLTVAGIAHFRDTYRAKFGDTLLDEVSLFDEHASIARALPGEPNRVVHYGYRGGFEQSRPVATRKPDTPQFDLAAVDLTALDRTLAEAPALLNVDGGTISHIDLKVDTAPGGSRTAPVALVRVYVRNAFGESGYLILDPAGVVLRAFPFSE